MTSTSSDTKKKKSNYLANSLAALVAHRAGLEEALKAGGGTHDFEDIVSGVISDEYIVYCLPNSVMVFEIICYPKKKVLHGFITSGSLEEILDSAELVYDLAKFSGCREVTMTARKGWKPFLDKLGWSDTLSVYRKEL